jgi:hypothetical protein
MAPHPGTIVSECIIDADYPRDRGSAEFGELYGSISGELTNGTRRAA